MPPKCERNSPHSSATAIWISDLISVKRLPNSAGQMGLNG
jgi:hypothetical protein